MSIPVSCPGCSKSYNVPDHLAGKKVACKECGEAIPIPEVIEGEPVDDFAASPLDLEVSSSRSRAPKPRGPRRPIEPRPSSSGGGSSAWKIVLAIFGGGVALAVLCCGGIAFKARSAMNDVAVWPNQPEFGDSSTRFPLDKYPLPQFPELGPGRPVGNGVMHHFVDFKSIPTNRGNAGFEMKLRVYVPQGDHAAKSLPCVLVAPAGTNMLEGNDLDDDEYHDETLPYAEAGMVVVFYSLDGATENQPEGDVRKAYLAFRAACAGLVNTRNALEYALAKVPQVDPQRIYTAGHSSAGTLSLLAATHEPRLKGSIAYAPVSDVELRLEGMQDIPGMGLLFPRIKEFAKQSSPSTHLQQIQCPIFLFHAADDSNVPVTDSRNFADKLRAAGKTVKLEEVATGDHYESMIEAGLPAGIKWIQNP